MRAGNFKMKQVVGYFRAIPFDWATREKGDLKHRHWTFIVLACGHIKRDPWEVYQNETAVRVRAFFHHVDPTAHARMARCTECVSGKRQSGAPKQLPSAYYDSLQALKDSNPC